MKYLRASSDGMWMLFFPVLSLFFVIFILVITDDDGVSRKQEVKACDIAVQQLMTTHDLVELQRDEWLIHHLRCWVTRRAVPILVPAK